jgi:hypothetical protein
MLPQRFLIGKVTPNKCLVYEGHRRSLDVVSGEKAAAANQRYPQCAKIIGVDREATLTPDFSRAMTLKLRSSRAVGRTL